MREIFWHLERGTGISLSNPTQHSLVRGFFGEVVEKGIFGRRAFVIMVKCGVVNFMGLSCFWGEGDKGCPLFDLVSVGMKRHLFT